MVDCNAEPPVECEGDDLVSAETLCDDVFKRGRRFDVSFHYFKHCLVFFILTTKQSKDNFLQHFEIALL